MIIIACVCVSVLASLVAYRLAIRQAVRLCRAVAAASLCPACGRIDDGPSRETCCPCGQIWPWAAEVFEADQADRNLAETLERDRCGSDWGMML